MKIKLAHLGFAIYALMLLSSCGSKDKEKDTRPNVLLLMSDNHTRNHLGAYGNEVVKTPNIDKIAKEGIRFNNAFCNAPSCTPARASMLTGRNIWELEDGGNLWGILPKKFEVYPDILEKSGYQVGFDGKGWGPGSYEYNGRSRNPAGNKYENFADFLKSKKEGQPWNFWFSSRHPHRPYEVGSGEKAGIDLSEIEVPVYFPDTEDVRIDVADYYAAIQMFDQEVGKIMQQLKESGELENTIVIVASDNGWQMPRGLANLYDFGMRVPFIVSWPDKLKKGEVLENLVTLKDLAPTFLDLADAEIPKEMNGKSLMPILEGKEENERDFVVYGRERHAFVRQNGLGYPGRAIRTKDFLYIRNYEPSRWPAGDPPLYGDVDPHMLHYPGPTKFYILKNKDKSSVKQAFELGFAKRPAEELYDIKNDPDELHNLAENKEYKSLKDSLSSQMVAYLKETEDPRETGGKIIWDDVPYFRERDKTPKPSKEAIRILDLDTMYKLLRMK